MREIVAAQLRFLAEKRVFYDKTETFKTQMKPETYYCRGLPYSANLPTEVKIRYLGLACPYLVIGFSTLIPRHGFNPVPTNFDCCAGWIRTNVDRLMRPGWDLLQSTAQCHSLY